MRGSPFCARRGSSNTFYLGSSGRTGTFHTDTNLPPNFDWVTYSDYTGSGYDRGHMCPSADRTVTTNANVETFLMSNIIPQAPDNNQGIWADLEDYCRTLASAGNEVLITCGPEGFGTNVTDSAGALPIASNVWKIIVVVPQGPGGALERLTSTSRVIAVKIPNVQGIRNDPWQNYLTTVNALQACTGFTFFSAVDPGLAPILRARLDGAPPDGITGFTPASGPAYTSVTLTGTNFTGATTVAFNGVAASFTLDSATQITATVPTNATTGPLSVFAAGGLAVSATPFTVSSAATNATALPPTLTAVSFSNQVFRFTVTGSTGTNYVVQSTTSLTTPPVDRSRHQRRAVRFYRNQLRRHPTKVLSRRPAINSPPVLACRLESGGRARQASERNCGHSPRDFQFGQSSVHQSARLIIQLEAPDRFAPTYYHSLS